MGQPRERNYDNRGHHERIRVAAECESRQLVSDLFHQLSQPLTTLCCSLELALLQTPTLNNIARL